MKYLSTRDKNTSVSAAEAIKKGLSKEGGLFVPESFPSFSEDELKNLLNAGYFERAKAVFKKYLSDFSDAEIEDCINKAYGGGKFENDEPAPLRSLNAKTHILELWHGPTCAFKDMALQILPHLMTYSMKKTGEDKTVVILVATSGDTGKAALDGFSDVPGTKIIVFYPDEGVSRIQKLQMVTQKGENVFVAAVKGNFDDAQNGVKAIFTDEVYNDELKEKGYVLSSANSINWGRLLPQIIYYVSSYLDLVKKGAVKQGDKINICVPTGNFGNILAAYYAKKMGIPVNKFICASNENNVLSDFFKTGVYNRNRPFYTTISPSMDILISSNLERLLFDISGMDEVAVNELMDSLKEKGEYKVSEEMLNSLKAQFAYGFCSDEETKKTISEIYEGFNYTCDTHTAVAINVYENYVKESGDNTPVVIVSTASPFKFYESVLDSISDLKTEFPSEFEAMEECSKLAGINIPDSLKELKSLPVLFSDKFEKKEMKNAVDQFLA